MSPALKSTIQTADEAIDLIRSTRSQLNRITALIWAMRTDGADGHALNLDCLSDMAQQLGQDLGAHLDERIEVLQSQLDAIAEPQKAPTL